jgi:hypothetical protein
MPAFRVLSTGILPISPMFASISGTEYPKWLRSAGISWTKLAAVLEPEPLARVVQAVHHVFLFQAQLGALVEAAHARQPGIRMGLDQA